MGLTLGGLGSSVLRIEERDVVRRAHQDANLVRDHWWKGISKLSDSVVSSHPHSMSCWRSNPVIEGGGGMGRGGEGKEIVLHIEWLGFI